MNSLQTKIEEKMTWSHHKLFSSKLNASQFIKYKPKTQYLQSSTEENPRVIQMQEIPSDPLDPPKHRLMKVPRAPYNEPVPVMHSPPNTSDSKKTLNWKIPPAISNWKNVKGYIIPLDKRLLADGRNLQETKINDNFAKLSEALYIAEQKAREDTELRRRIAEEHALREKEKKDTEMRASAMQARMEKTLTNENKASSLDEKAKELQNLSELHTDNNKEEKKRENSRERRKRIERNEIREERRREREKDRRIAEAGGHKYKKGKLFRDRDRDISERVALGLVNVQKITDNVMYDQLLFDQKSKTQLIL